jgi:hypothetical protein
MKMAWRGAMAPMQMQQSVAWFEVSLGSSMLKSVVAAAEFKEDEALLLLLLLLVVVVVFEDEEEA